MPHLLGESIQFLRLLEKRGINISVLYCHIPQHPHDIGKFHILWAVSTASEALGTVPDEIRGKHPFLHPHQDHPNDLPWIEVFGNLAHRAPCGANSAGIANLQLLSSGLTRHLILELGV